MKSKARLIINSTLSTLMLAAVSSCASDTVRVSQATARFHRQFKGSNYRDIYKESSELLKSKMKEEEFVTKLQKVRLLVGEIQSMERADDPFNRIIELSDSKLACEAHRLRGTTGKCLELTWWHILGNKIELDGFECLPES